MKQFLMSCAGLAALTLASCAPPADGPSEGADASTEMAQAEAANEAPRYGTFGMDVAGMDTSVHPGNNFNHYANGTWLAETELPGDR